MNSSLKSMAGRALLWGGLHRPIMNQTAAIVAFHRVDDAAAHDPISVPVAAFQSFCRLVGRHFHVVALPELLARLSKGEDVSNRLVITFDDGYADNHETAAPILREQGLPATFFIATDLIGTDTQPFWDRKAGIRTRWMTWEQVRDLHRQGFELGAHTRTHANLNALSPAEARDEVSGSRNALEDALGAKIRWFSYPFGGRSDFNEDLRALVTDMGFECCLSCHGGLVRAGDSPINLQRVPVNNYYRDFWHFGAALVQSSRLGQ